MALVAWAVAASALTSAWSALAEAVEAGGGLLGAALLVDLGLQRVQPGFQLADFRLRGLQFGRGRGTGSGMVALGLGLGGHWHSEHRRNSGQRDGVR